MSYIVLARKWRSRHFDEVVGQDHVARTLTNAIEQDRVAHAFLFCGPRGVGKTSTARILAKALNCHRGPTPRPCYSCPSCEEISAGTSIDVFEIDGASNRGVNEIRELRDSVRYAANRDRYRVYIIDEVHMLTTEAFNALLKTLEEPPPHVKFIFATTEPQKIPVTILSRCQRFDFKRISVRRITEHLQDICGREGIEAEAGGLTLIARQADGCMRDALSLTDQVISFSQGQITQKKVAEILGVAGRDTLFRLSGALLGRQVEDALLLLDEVNRGGHDLMRFAAALVAHLRDLTLVRVSQGRTTMTDMTPGEVEEAMQQVSQVDTSVLHRMFQITVQAAEDMSRSTFPRMVFEMAVLKLAEIEPLMPMDILLDRLASLESGLLVDLDSGHGGGGSGSSGGSAPPRASGGGSAGPPSAPPTTQQAAPRSPEPPAARPSPPRPAPVASAALAAPPAQERTPPPLPPMAPPTLEKKVNGAGHNGAGLNGSGHNGASRHGSEVNGSGSHGSEANGHAGPRPSAVATARVDPRPAPPLEEPTWARQDPRPAPPIEGQRRQAQPREAAPAPVVVEEEPPSRGVIQHRSTDAPPEPMEGAMPPEEARALWKELVQAIEAPATAATMRQAHLVGIKPGVVKLEMLDYMMGLYDAEKHQPLFEAAASRALGELQADRWTLVIEVTGTARTHPLHRSLEAEAEEAARLACEAARERIRSHEVVLQVMKIFAADKIRVVLDEEGHYT